MDFTAQRARLPRTLAAVAVQGVVKLPAPGPEAAMPQFVMGTETRLDPAQLREIEAIAARARD